MAQIIQMRRGTAAQATSANPVLASGEIGFETDTGLFKFGDGVTAWTALDYAAANMDAASILAALLTVDGPGSGLNADTLDGVSSAGFEVAGTVATHSADTTSVHGIADTSALETSTGSQAKVDTHVNDTTAAHAATAIAFTPAGTIAATTVQAAIEEVASEAGGGATTLDGLSDVVATGGSTGDVLTQQSDGSFALEAVTLSGTLPIANGGTGATDAAGARTALGLGTAATTAATAYATAAQGTTADAALPKVAGGASVENIGAVESNTNTVVATGATETLDTSVYGVHDCTMDQACTFTFSNPAPSGKCTMFTLILRGAFTPTWPAAVDWPDATQPTYTTPSIYTFMTVDGGTTWLGAQVGKAFG